MKKLRFLWLSIPFLACLAISACGDDEGTIPPVTAELCYLLFDENGNPLGTHGDCPQTAIDEQWSNTMLTPAQLALFNFTDTSQVSDAATPTINGFFPYPLPVSSARVMSVSLSSSGTSKVKVKVAFTDRNDKRIATFALPLAANGSFQVQLNETDFPFGKPYRMYYQILGNADTEVLYQGFGNMLICDALPVTDVAGQCF